MTEEKTEKDFSVPMILTLSGTISFFIANFVPTIELFFFFFTLGIGLFTFGVVSFFISVKALDKQNLRKNRRGAIWIWAVCLLSIVVLAFAWFTLTWPAFILIETIEGEYTFPPEATAGISLIKAVMGWFLILMCLGLLLWAYVMSQKREEVTYPY